MDRNTLIKAREVYKEAIQAAQSYTKPTEYKEYLMSRHMYRGLCNYIYMVHNISAFYVLYEYLSAMKGWCPHYATPPFWYYAIADMVEALAKRVELIDKILDADEIGEINLKDY